MRADVTVGAFLSGGIDSTAIAALAREHNPDLITLTSGFERAGCSTSTARAREITAGGSELCCSSCFGTASSSSSGEQRIVPVVPEPRYPVHV